MKIIEKTFRFIQKNHLDYFLVFLLAVLVFFYIQSPATLPDPDSFYHAEMAELIRDRGIIQDFPWTQFSTLKNNYIDHHFLYHLYLIPFTLFFNPLIAIKAATIFLDIFLVLIFYAFLAHFKIRWRFFWVMALLTVNPFIFRISLAKAPGLSIIFLLLGVYALINYRRKLLFFLSFFYVWAYGGWPLLWIVSLIYFTVDYFYERLHRQSIFLQTIKLVINPIHPLKQRKKRWQLFGFLAGGTILGLIINPYFPKNLYFYYQQIYQIAVVNMAKTIGVGGEWYPYKLMNLIRDTGLVFPILFVVIILFFWNVKKQSRVTIVLAFLTMFFLFYTLRARRSVEYFVPFALLFSAFSLNDSFKSFWANSIFDFKYWFWPWWRRLIIIYFIGLALVFGWLGYKNNVNVHRDIGQGLKLTHFKAAGEWLTQNTPARSIVLHSDWDEFPMLFYYANNNYYINGLDQTFMYNYDKNLFWEWVDITQGQKFNDLTSKLKNDFFASYIFIENGHQAMDNLFIDNSDFKLVYRDQEAKIYQVK